MRAARRRWCLRAVSAIALGLAVPQVTHAAEGDFVTTNFSFQSGESLPELRLHYLTLGTPRRDAQGEITNGILILHGTAGSGRQFLAKQFADLLYGRGAPLDTTRWYIILPDGIGHGRSSKPSDGLRSRFPRYDYDDMVRAQHRLLTEHLGVRHLRLVMGTSMGGMQAWVWGETYPEFTDALMPLACLPVAIVGRNRLWRQMVVNAIHEDPEWKGGDYESQPRAGLRAAIDLLLIAGSAPAFMQRTLAARDSVDGYLHRQLESKRVKRGHFVLVPASDQTHGHGTHTWPVFWKSYLVALLARSER